MQDGSEAFRARCAIEVDGSLDDDALRKVVERILSRHEMLRVSFHRRPGMKMPIQVVGQERNVRWEEVDLRGMSAPEQNARLQAVYEMRDESARQADSGPAIIASLVRLAEDNRILTMNLPSLCADGWSLNTLAGEIVAAGATRSKATGDATDDFQYFNFSEWQDEMLESEDEEGQRGKAYWAREAPYDRSPVLPQENRAEEFVRFAPRSMDAEIAPATGAGIRETAARFEVSEREVLAACWASLISRLSGEEEVVIWRVMDGRKFEELSGAVGLYAKSVPVRSVIRAGEQIGMFLLESSENLREAFELHEYYNNEGETSRVQAAYQHPISFEYWDGARRCSDGEVTYTLLRQYSCIDRFKLKLSCFDSGDLIRTEIHYDPTVYDDWTITLLVARLNRIIQQAVADPKIAIGRIDLLSDIERHCVLVERNDTDRAYPEGRCIHELFEDQASRTPEAVAVVFEDHLVTYGELNRRANQLAHHLRSIGVAPDRLVALYLDRSTDLTVGMLGVLKAGGAYVPLDPSYPRRRLAMILEDTAASVIVTSQHLAAGLSEYNGKVVRLDADRQVISVQDEHSPSSGVTSENLVYAIFTSGSSGRPKGVAVEHRQLLNYVLGVTTKLTLPEGASFATVSTLAADLGNTAIYPSLVLGGCLHIISFERATDPVALGDYFSWHRIDCLKIVPSHFAALLASSSPELLMPTKRLILGGEASRSSWVEELRRLAPDCAIFNHYGPTETTVGVFTHRVAASEVRDSCSSLPLGRPVPNTRGFILDREMQPLPTGVAGELCIAGAGVTRGYLSNPAATAASFIPNPFSSQPGTRLYQTGDMVRHLPNGNVEFLGRCDNQIKFHGYRVELNEIRTALNRHPMIRDSVAVVAADDKGNQAIVAHYVSRQAIDVAQLREFLADSLIEETIPNVYVHLKRMPLTINGKVDYRALPSLEEAKQQIKRTHLPPRTTTEELIAGIWGEVLGLERLGIEDNFFELGGHSLLATQVISRVRNLLEVELPLRALFESPTVAGLAEAVESERKSRTQAEAPLILPVSRNRELPLSFAQQRLWFIHQLEPDSPSYNIPRAVRLRGGLGVSVLRQCLQEIARRHEVLRTRFDVRNGQPEQVIEEEHEIAVPIWDVSDLTEGERENIAREIARQEALRPFSLERGPIWRAALLRMCAEDHVLLLDMHHVASDAWSTGVLVNEFTALYEAFRAGAASPFAELPLQYADFAVWQRDWLRAEVLETELGYWRQQLGGAPTLEVPTDRPRPAMPGYRGAHISFRVSEELTHQLRDLSQREGVTLFMTLLAAFQMVLGRYAGQDDVVVGTDVANRNRMETEGLIGFFVNQLVLRTDLSGSPSFRELLGRVKETTLSAYAHQDIPFEKLVEELVSDRDLSRSPLFQVKLICRNAPQGDLQMAGVGFTNFCSDNELTKLDLTLSVEEENEGLNGWAGYKTELYEGSSAARLVEHLRLALEAMARNMDQRIGEIALATRAEMQQVLVEWNDTRRAFGETGCLHELLEEQAVRTADSVAVIVEDLHLSYRALDEQAEVLASHLQELGVGPEIQVGICAERSFEMMIGLLGILKAGGAYVPLDPSYPRERLACMIADARAQVLVTQQHLVEELPEYRGKVVCVEEICAERGRTTAGLRRGVTAQNLAYVIYTSGSTGRPKGAMNTHGGIVNRLQWMDEVYGLASKDRVLQKTTISFDVSVWELFWPLMTGAVLVMARPGGQRDSRYLREVIEREEITTLHFVPSMLESYVEAEGWIGCQSLERVICSGEALTAGVARRFQERGGSGLYNLYGPTEAAVDVSYKGCEEVGDGMTVEIGRPIANMGLYVVDSSGQVAGVGVKGELYIGGVGLGRGYWGRAEQTAERYMADWLSGEGGERLYRTGDSVRWKATGELEYIGRLDDQVKVRGFRVELGEIEAALLEHEAVRQCAVVLREHEGGDKRLVGYVVPSEEGTVREEQLRRHLRGKLPEYMVPWVIVELKEMPLTANGKLDRKRLPAAVSLSVEAEIEGSLELTPTEEIVLEIWCDVLRLEKVGRDQNFFELGGHSLLATQVVSRVREALGVEIALREVFESPTVAGLAEAVERGAGWRLDTRPIERVSRERELPLSYAQQRLWFIQQLEPESAAYNVAMGMRLAGRLNLASLKQSLGEIARRHEVLRTRFEAREGRGVQVIEEGGEIELAVWDLSALEGGECEERSREILRNESERPFDLERGPVWRSGLVRMSEQEHVLALSMHHVVSDAWSIGVMVKEFAELYEANERGGKVTLQELPVQYADYAVWQKGWLEGEVLDEQLEYWKEHLAGVPALELPTDRRRRPVASHTGATVPFELGAELTQQLKELSRREGVTLFMTLLAAFQVVLGRHAVQDDVAIGAPIANRNRLQTERLIGFFVNQLVLRTCLSGNPTARETLRRVRETTLGAYAHQDIPFEKLVEELAPARDLGRTPLFQVVFTLQNVPQENIRVRGLNVSKLGATHRVARFDLTLSLMEGGDGVSGVAEYATDLYEGSSIERLLGHVRLVLEAMARDPEQQIGEISLLTQEDREKVVREWNQTETEYPAGKCVHELFELQVERTPEAVATVYADRQLSYAELNRCANQLANYLTRVGVSLEARVGLCFERSPEMVVALVATLKAGGTYVPLDSRYPAERLAYILEDSQVGIVLTQHRLSGSLEGRAKMVVIAEAWEDIACESDTNPDLINLHQSLAYVIYTSGSTGEPKGVCITHQAVGRLVFNTNYIDLDASDIVAQVSNTSFDAATFEIWGGLLHGGRLAFIQSEEVLSPVELAARIDELNVTTIFLTTALFNQMARLRPSGFKNVGTVLFGGEAVDSEWVRRILAAGPNRLLHVYGPTESTTFATWNPVHCVSEDAVTVPIGKPVSNTTAYVLDYGLEPAPVGVVGELYLGGDGLARAYQNRPDLTAEKFLPDSFGSGKTGSSKIGRRVYRTGDIVRRLGDGSIEFIGRNDHQVKLRGFRVEMGEIESVLLQHFGVRQCVVDIREDEPGDKRLVAYIVASEASQPLVADLREHVKKKLPEYMAPSAYVFLDELPLTPNGKIDRHALAKQKATYSEMGPLYVAPQTSLEQAIASVWSEVLNLEKLSVHDNFFDLGGHSLLLVRAHSMLQDKLDAGLRLIELFEYPTIRSLAAHLSNNRGDTDDFRESFARAELRRERTKVRRQQR